MAGARTQGIDPPANAVEIASERTAFSKTYDMGGGVRRVILSQFAQHVPRDMVRYLSGQSTQFDDPDDTFDDDAQAGELVMRNGWYGLRVLKDAVGFTYQSKVTGGQLRIRLLEIDGNAVGTVAAPTRVGNRLIWADVAPGNDFHLVVRRYNVEMFKVVKNATAGRRFRWRVIESADRSIWGADHDLQTQGHDNYLMQEPTRDGLGPGRIRRRLVMAAPIKGAEDSTSLPGYVTYQFLERWTGNTVALDANRVPSTSAAVVYPVLIDVTVNESIAANGDDGDQIGSNASTGTTWNNSYASTGDHIIYDPSSATLYHAPGWRFTTVAVPQGATINSATLTLTLKANSSGTGAAATVYGNAHDNAPAWANNAGPINMTRTTASVSFGTWGGNQTNPTTRNLTVTAIIQEIVNRAGWASNNALALGVANFTQNNNGSFHYIDDLAGGATGIAALQIDYTAGGGTTYNESVSESGSASDTVSSLLTAVGAVTETGSAADTLTTTLIATRSIAETGSAADALSSLLVAAASVAESASAADVVSALATMNSALTEAGSATDSVNGSTSGSTYSVSLSESGAATDAVSALLAAVATIAEAGNASDVIGGQLVAAALIIESGAAADTVSSALTAIAALIEAGAATDTVAVIDPTTSGTKVIVASGIYNSVKARGIAVVKPRGNPTVH